MEFKIIIAGIGPGAKEYVVPEAQRVIDAAQVLVGGGRALNEFSHPGQITFPIKGKINIVIDFIREKLQASDVVVMVSGDPGYYSMLKTIRENFPLEQLVVIPGISSMQLAFAKVALPYQDATLLSFHGRIPKDEELVYYPGKIIGTLTDGKFNTQNIARYLMERNWPGDCTFHICEALSYPHEKIITSTLEDAREGYIASHCVVIVEG